MGVIQYTFPAELDGRINALSCVVNNEMKIVTLLHLDDTLAEGPDLLARIREDVGDIRVSRGSNLAGYCRDTFLPIGTVVYEEEVRRRTGEVISCGYRLSEAGRDYGIPVGVFFLMWGVDHNVALYNILGTACSHGRSRGPFNSIKILRGLRNGHKRLTDLVNYAELANPAVLAHLKRLRSVKMITYEGIPEVQEIKGTIKFRYLGKEGDPEPHPKYQALTPRVYATLKKIGEGSYLDVTKAGRFRYDNWVGAVLCYLEQIEYVERIGFFKGQSELTRTTITDLGKEFVDDFSIVENALSDGNGLAILHGISERFFAEGKFIQYQIKGIENHWKASPYGKIKPVGETAGRILIYLSEHPGARPKKMRKDLGLKSVHDYLRPLFKGGLIRKEIAEENKCGIRYYLA